MSRPAPLAAVGNLILSKEADAILQGIARNPSACEKLSMFFRLIAEEKQAMLVTAPPELIPVTQGEAKLAIQLAQAFET